MAPDSVHSLNIAVPRYPPSVPRLILHTLRTRHSALRPEPPPLRQEVSPTTVSQSQNRFPRSRITLLPHCSFSIDTVIDTSGIEAEPDPRILKSTRLLKQCPFKL
jgi:hypothetical protein